MRRKHRVFSGGLLVGLMLGNSLTAFAQSPGFEPPPSTPQESAPLDVTGYWVALVTEDWLWRMVTPQRGDVTSVPLNPVGRQVANAWDLARDNANGEQCRVFGAAGLMRLPLRLHISWEDEDTLRIDTDVGEQTRLLHFSPDAERAAEPSRQGRSLAAWTRSMGEFDMRAFFGDPKDTPEGPVKASMRVVTDNLRPGYLRKNGVPYSEQTRLREYFSTIEHGDNAYLTVLSIVSDPVYLNGDFVTSSHFKREADDANWNPGPCYTAPPAAVAATAAEGAEP